MNLGPTPYKRLIADLSAMEQQQGELYRPVPPRRRQRQHGWPAAVVERTHRRRGYDIADPEMFRPIQSVLLTLYAR